MVQGVKVMVGVTHKLCGKERRLGDAPGLRSPSRRNAQLVVWVKRSEDKCREKLEGEGKEIRTELTGMVTTDRW